MRFEAAWLHGTLKNAIAADAKELTPANSVDSAASFEQIWAAEIERMDGQTVRFWQSEMAKYLSKNKGDATAKDNSEKQPPFYAAAANTRLTVNVKQFFWAKKPLGQMQLTSSWQKANGNRPAQWALQNFSWQNKGQDIRLEAEEQWFDADNVRAQFNLTQFKVANLGEWLSTWQANPSIDETAITASGALAWQSRLQDFSADSAPEGQINLKMEKGRFKRLEVKNIGILNLLSVDAFFKRLTLDFKDVLKEGFFFDSVSCELALEKTSGRFIKPLRIESPILWAEVAGDMNLTKKELALDAKVVPKSSNLLTIGTLVTVANPVVGLSVWLSQKILGNPLEKIFFVRYRIHGPWDAPIVEETKN